MSEFHNTTSPIALKVASDASRKLQRDLQESIAAAKTAQTLISIINKFPIDLDEINVTAALTSFVRFKRTTKQYSRLPDKVTNFRLSADAQPRTLSSVLWAAGALKADTLLTNFPLPLALTNWSIRDLTNAAWGAASTGAHSATGIVKAMAAELETRHLNAAQSQELASLVWSCAKTGTPVAPAVLNELTRRVDRLNGQDMAMVLWSLAKLQQEAGNLFCKFSTALIASPPTLTPQGMANIVWAYSENHRKQNRELFESLAGKIDFRLMSAQQVSAVLLGFAKEDAVLPSAGQTECSWSQFPLREHQNCLWALTRYKDSEMFALCIEEFNKRDDLHRMTADDIYALTRAIGRAYT